MNNLRQAAQVALASMRQMLQSGEWYCAQERADALEAALAEPQPKPRREFLLLAEKCGAVLTGKGDGSESVTVVFTVNAWRAFDAALAEPQPVKWNELDALKDEYWNEPQPEPVAPPGYILVPESLAEPTEEMLQAFQKAFVQQLHRRRNKPSLESAERAGLRAMLKAGEKAEALQAQQHQSEPVAYGSDDGYWVRACDYQLRPDKERFTELFYAAPQAQAPQPEPVADAYNIDARIAAIAADRDYWREQATGPQSEPVPVAVVKSCVGRGSDGVRITWLAGFPQIGDRLYAKPKAQQPRFVKPWQERLPCSPMDCSSSEVVAAQQAEIDEWRNGQALQPLGYEQIVAIWSKHMKTRALPNYEDFARDIEAAHGIGVKNGPAGTSHVSSET